jgi:single-strand DNA-binding protein
MVEGHLLLDQWTDKASGEKRSKLLVIVDNFQFLDAKQGQGGEPRRQEQRGDADEGMAPVPAGRGDDDIPF